MRRFRIALLALPLCASAQSPMRPPLQQPTAATPTHTFRDPTYKLSFDYPATWNFSAADGDLSTFHLDARSAPRNASLRAVLAMPENPFPASTFSGAYVYFSVTPHTSSASCAREALPPRTAANRAAAKPTRTVVNDIPFTHGRDQVKDICITQRDEVYTARHHGACYRFDLAENNFCGGEVSSVKYISPGELDQVRHRLESILSTIRFDPE